MSKAINYQTAGSGIPFLFIHGLGADLTQSQQLLDSLRGIQKIYVDCPGHGRSEFTISTSPSFNDMSDRIIRLLDDLEIELFVVGGISMGAAISTNLMVRFPRRLRGAVLVRPAWLDQTDPANLTILSTVADYLEKPDGKSSFQQLDEYQRLLDDLPLAAQSIVSQFDRPQGPAPTARLFRSMVADRPIDHLSALAGFRAPVSIITNDHDPTHPSDYGNALHRYLPHADHRSVFSRYLDPARHDQEVRKIIQEFIDSNFTNGNG